MNEMCIAEIECNNCFAIHIINDHDGLFFDENSELLTKLDYCKYCVK